MFGSVISRMPTVIIHTVEVLKSAKTDFDYDGSKCVMSSSPDFERNLYTKSEFKNLKTTSNCALT